MIEKLWDKELERWLLLIPIEGNEYERCVRFSLSAPTRSRSIYQKNDQDKKKIVRVGAMGEVASSKWLNYDIDLEGTNRQTSDFFIKDKNGNEFGIEIKTALKRPYENKGLVLQCNQQGKICPLKSDVYMFFYLKTEDLENKKGEVVFVGALSKNLFKEEYIKKSEVGSHYNYEIDYKIMMSPEKFYHWIKKYL